ncbi:MAG: translation initiation factor eIF-1A [Candidatus Diapherotrites archaeon]|nr:translation initiation factor eIF-1A [Candidatus Diapherotrites archaeon]
MGDREQDDQQEQEFIFKKLRMPNSNELEQFAVISKLMGTNKVMALCQDGKERNCRIPGRMKKRVWLREGDLVIVKLWEFQKDKADIEWRYSNNEKYHLAKKGLLKGLPV